jgi:hypothetical protein
LAEQISYTLELKLEINEASKRDIEYQLQKLGDDIYAANEAATLKSA